MCTYGECQIGILAGAALKKIESLEKNGSIALHVFPKGKTGKGKVGVLCSNR